LLEVDAERVTAVEPSVDRDRDELLRHVDGAAGYAQAATRPPLRQEEVRPVAGPTVGVGARRVPAAEHPENQVRPHAAGLAREPPQLRAIQRRQVPAQALAE